MDHSLYRKRVVDEIIEQYLQAFGAVCIEGPKWCGKTWTAEKHSKSAFYVGDPTGNFQNRELAKLNPNFKEGRPKKFSREQIKLALQLLAAHSYKQVEEMTGISISTLKRAKKTYIAETNE